MDELKPTRLRAEELRAQGQRPVEIARSLGVSRQRVYEILGRVPRPLPVCAKCGNEFQRSKRSRTICSPCHREIYLEHQVELVCPQCGQTFSLPRSDVRARKVQREQRGSTTEIFHSRECSIEWHKERRNDTSRHQTKTH